MPAPFHTHTHDQAAWVMLRRAECHDPHKPIPMLLMVDRGPVKMFGCPLERCRETRYVYGELPAFPPSCAGGMKWSFSTTTRFDGEDNG